MIMDNTPVMDFKAYLSSLSEKQTELMRIVAHGTLANVRNLAHSLRASNRDDELFSYVLLVTALRREHKTIIKFFIKQNCPVIVPQKTGTYFSPLYYAVKMHDLDIFRALWKKGASFSDKDANDETALELAMYQNDYNIIDFVLNELGHSKSMKNLKPDQEDDVALFHAACWNGDLKAIEAFLSLGFSLNSRSKFKKNAWKEFTPVHFSIENLNASYRTDTAITLLRHSNVDLLAKDKRGRTPIDLAFRSGHGHILGDDVIMERIGLSMKNNSMNPEDKNGLSHFHIICSLKTASEDGLKQTSLVESFISGGVDVNAPVSLEDEDFPGFTALHFAVRASSWRILRQLLANGADPSKADRNGSTPLHFVCKNLGAIGDIGNTIVQLLAYHGADTVARNCLERTPVHEAFYSHAQERPLNESEKFLLWNNQQSINYTDKYGISYLHMACTGNDLGVIKTLVANGAQVNSFIRADSPKYAGYSALLLSVKFNQAEIVEFLLSQGADPNCESGWCAHITPLLLACNHSSVEQAYPGHRELISSVDDIDYVTHRENHIRIIELLVKYGASVNATDTSGRTPLMQNCSIPRVLQLYDFSMNQRLLRSIMNENFIRQKKIMDILLDHGADINIHESLGGSILHIISKKYENHRFDKLLLQIALEKGADPNSVEGVRKFTPLHEAVEESIRKALDVSLINLLLGHGANINAKADHLNTPLHLAAQSCNNSEAHGNIVARLLNHPCINMDSRNNRGRTPLFVAIDRGIHLCTKQLLSCGADINIGDRDGHSPIHALLKRLARTPTILENDEDFRALVIIVLRHVKELMKLKLYISEKVSRDFSRLSGYLSDEYWVSIDSAIAEELEYFKSHKLDTYTSFYDILFRDPNAMVKHVMNSYLQDVIGTIHSRSELTFFSNFLKKQYDRGCKRSKILEPAKIALNFVTNVSWPDSCSEHILSYLSDENLRNIMKSAPAKRILETASKDSMRFTESSAKISRHGG